MLAMTERSFLFTVVIVVIGCEFTSFIGAENPVLTIEDGPIRGQTKLTAGEDKLMYVFRGIPYAQPPIGDLRFQSPVKNEKWNVTLDATQDKSECTQGSSPVTGSEDCLYINVYTPSLNASHLPVMVWIYGGAFTEGNSSYSLYSPDFFLNENVVFVSFNYRVGIFGFISTNDMVAPGNIGMKDQVLALKWVKRNIHFFGGDSQNVTIFGQSAGSASVSYHLQSPLSQGLFKAAILQSGSSLCLWALNRRSKETAFLTGIKLGIKTSNSQTLLEELRKVDYKTLQNVSMSAATIETLKDPLAGIFWGPVMEPNHPGAFFSNFSDLQMSQGYFSQVPILMGQTSHEAAAASDLTGLLRILLIKFDLDNLDLAPFDLTRNKFKRSIAATMIRWRYFGILPLAVQTNRGLEFVSDDQFNRPITRTALNMNNYVPTYFYVFSYEGALGRLQRTIPGVGHGEELQYLFVQNNSLRASPNDTLISRQLIRLWTNFAKYNHPTPSPDPILSDINWPTSETIPGRLLYLNISYDLNLQIDPFAPSMEFYERIYSRYGDYPFDTY